MSASSSPGARPMRWHVLLGEGEAGLDIKGADALRRAVVVAVAARHTPIIVDIVFTAIEDFAAPITGFVVDQACGSTLS
jgi:hypothetical protein